MLAVRLHWFFSITFTLSVFLSRQVSDFTAKKQNELMRLLSHSDFEMCLYHAKWDQNNNGLVSPWQEDVYS